MRDPRQHGILDCGTSSWWLMVQYALRRSYPGFSLIPQTVDYLGSVHRSFEYCHDAGTSFKC